MKPPSPQPHDSWPRQFGEAAEPLPDPRTLCKTTRSVPWCLRPRSLEELRRVIEEANRNSAAIHPVSRGLNWGFGSHLPAKDGVVVVDLSALAEIRDLDLASSSVRIEPGVTQGQLAEFLQIHAPELMLNVTGSGIDTSVLGNALERGIGYLGEKDRDVYCLEVLLADGTCLTPTKERNHNSRAKAAGLDSDSLFFQTNFGVVVAARIKLRRRQQTHQALVIEGPFESVVATLKVGYDQQLLTLPTRIAEPGRSYRLGFGLLRQLFGRDPTELEVTKCFPDRKSYTALAAVHGRTRVVKAVIAELRRLALPGVRIRRVNASKLNFAAKLFRLLGATYKATYVAAIRPIMAFTWGEPSNAGLAALDGAGANPDHGSLGAIYGNAISSCSAEEASAVCGIVRAVWPESAFTWQIIDRSCIMTIYTLHFSSADAPDAHRANARIVSDLRAHGFPQYRLAINTSAAPGAALLASRLKMALDPNNIISPGKYE